MRFNDDAPPVDYPRTQLTDGWQPINHRTYPGLPVGVLTFHRIARAPGTRSMRDEYRQLAYRPERGYHKTGSPDAPAFLWVNHPHPNAAARMFLAGERSSRYHQTKHAEN